MRLLLLPTVFINKSLYNETKLKIINFFSKGDENFVHSWSEENVKGNFSDLDMFCHEEVHEIAFTISKVNAFTMDTM